MAKKNKEDSPNPNSVPNRDIIQRLNFLYQASSYLNGIAGAHPQASPLNLPARPAKVNEPVLQCDAPMELGEGEEKAIKGAEEKCPKGSDARKRQGKRKATAHDLARSYVKSMKIIGQKTNVKMDPSVKRTMCKGCNTLLMPGVTAKVRVKPLPSHGHAVSYICMHCSFSRRIPAPPITEHAYQLFAAQRKEPAESPPRIDADAIGTLPDTVEAEASTSTVEHVKQLKSRSQKRKRSPIKPRPLPFFAKADHIIFVGNDRVDRKLEDGGLIWGQGV